MSLSESALGQFQPYDASAFDQPPGASSSLAPASAPPPATQQHPDFSQLAGEDLSQAANAYYTELHQPAAEAYETMQRHSWAAQECQECGDMQGFYRYTALVRSTASVIAGVHEWMYSA